MSPRLKGRLNTDPSPQNFWTTFLVPDLTEKFKKSAVVSAIAIPLPLCFSCFIPLRRFQAVPRKLDQTIFYFYLSHTCDSPGGTPSVISLALRVGSIPTPHLKTFEQLFWTTTWRKNSRKTQWQTQLRYLCHCAFFGSFRYAGSEKTWSNHFISISLALVTLPALLRR